MTPAGATPGAEYSDDSYLPASGNGGYRVLHYDLDLAWTPSTRTLDAVATIELRSTTDGDHLQLALGEPLEVASVTLDGTDVPHTEAVGLCEDTSVLGRTFYLMGFVDGWSPMELKPAPGTDGPRLWPEPGTAMWQAT